jgi:hypothetical protein
MCYNNINNNIPGLDGGRRHNIQLGSVEFIKRKFKSPPKNLPY